MQWGDETDTDDTEGRPVATSDLRPVRARTRSTPPFPRFTGSIAQVPPSYSAIKIDGERAYDLARDGEVVELKPARSSSMRLAPDGARRRHARPSTRECGKGTYVRAIARDLGRTLGCLGHVTALRRTRVGPFTLDDTVTWLTSKTRRKPRTRPLLSWRAA